jgi:hypothetical protein
MSKVCYSNCGICRLSSCCQDLFSGAPLLTHNHICIIVVLLLTSLISHRVRARVCHKQLTATTAPNSSSDKLFDQVCMHAVALPVHATCTASLSASYSTSCCNFIVFSPPPHCFIEHAQCSVHATYILCSSITFSSCSGGSNNCTNCS